MINQLIVYKLSKHRMLSDIFKFFFFYSNKNLKTEKLSFAARNYKEKQQILTFNLLASKYFIDLL